MDALIDNASAAGAGRAFYENKPNVSDIIALSHVLTASILCDRTFLDGSSRYMRPHIKGVGYARQNLPVIWTWERRYPALSNLGLIDQWLGVSRYEAFIEPIAKYLCKLSKPLSDFLKDENLIESIPDAYKSPKYFDLNQLKRVRAEVEKEIGPLTQEQFLFVIYAWRGIYYHESSKKLGITYFPNPERQRVIENILVPGDEIIRHSEEAVKFLIETLSNPRMKLLKKLQMENEDQYQIDVPPIFAYLISDCKSSREEIVIKAKALRESPECVNLREWITKYDIAYHKGDLLELKKRRDEVNASFQKLSKKLEIDDREPVKITPQISLGNLGQVAIENLLEVKIPSIIYTNLFQKDYLTLLWRISKATLVNGFPNELLKLDPVVCSPDAQWVFIDQPDIDIDFDKDLDSDVKVRDGSTGETFEKSWRN